MNQPTDHSRCDDCGGPLKYHTADLFTCQRCFGSVALSRRVHALVVLLAEEAGNEQVMEESVIPLLNIVASLGQARTNELMRRAIRNG